MEDEEEPPVLINVLLETSSSAFIEVVNNSTFNFMFQWMLDAPETFKLHPACGKVRVQERKIITIDRLSKAAAVELAMLFKQCKADLEMSDCWHCTFFEDDKSLNMIPLKVHFRINWSDEVGRHASPWKAGITFLILLFFLLIWNFWNKQDSTMETDVFSFMSFREML